MDWSIRRNIKERDNLWKQIQKMKQDKEAAWDAIDDLDDESWDEEFDRIAKEYDTTNLFNKMFYLEYPESRNEWYKGFVQSFGVCKNKRISNKQAEIFTRYCEAEHEYSYGRGSNYYGRCGNLGIKCTVFTIHEPAYVTIIELI